MSRYYDNWERLVEAVLRNEQLRQLASQHSRSPSTTSLSSDVSLSFRSRLDDQIFDQLFSSTLASPIHEDTAPRRLPAKRTSKWRSLLIFSAFTAKKDYAEGDRQILRAHTPRTLNDPEPPKPASGSNARSKNKQQSGRAEEDQRHAAIARLRELHTLKGHLESVLKIKGIDIEKMQLNYTV